MADVTGALHHKFGKTTYTLRLTYGVLGKLQGLHGRDLKGLLTDPGAVPPFDVMVDVVALALEKGHGIKADKAADLADEMLSADPGLVARVMTTAFPDASGKGAAAQGKAST